MCVCVCTSVIVVLKKDIIILFTAIGPLCLMHPFNYCNPTAALFIGAARVNINFVYLITYSCNY